MREFKVLDAALDSDLNRWTSLWEGWPDREVMANPSYVKLFARPVDRVLCATFVDDNGTVMLPFILRPLAVEPWVPNHESSYDIITPYGYGGPFRMGHPSAGDFWLSLRSWAEQNRVVSLFARLSLFPDQLIEFNGTTERKSLNVVRTLNLASEVLWMQYDHKVRKNVNKAIRSGLAVSVDLAGDRLDEFLGVYYSTMERRQASTGYYFSPGFFRAIISDLPDQFAFFHALRGDKVLSTELVLVSSTHIYSFLGGTLPEAFPDRANDLLKHHIILWGAQQQKRAYVLGGGYTDQDGIFAYKRSFAADGVLPFMVGTMVFDQANYLRLVSARAEAEAAGGGSWSPTPGFFPAYRA